MSSGYGRDETEEMCLDSLGNISVYILLHLIDTYFSDTDYNFLKFIMLV